MRIGGASRLVWWCPRDGVGRLGLPACSCLRGRRGSGGTVASGMGSSGCHDLTPPSHAATPAAQRPPPHHGARAPPSNRTAEPRLDTEAEDTQPSIMPHPDHPTKPQVSTPNQVLTRYTPISRWPAASARHVFVSVGLA